MLKHKLTRSIGLGVAALLAVSGATVGTAMAAGPGTGNGGNGLLTFSPASGSNLTYPNFITNGGCPAAADGYKVSVSGPGNFATGEILPIPTSIENFSSSAGFTSAASANSILDLAKDLGGSSAVNLAGEYVFTLSCIDTFDPATALSTFVGSQYFSTPSAYSSTNPNATTTVVTASQAVGNTSINASATVSGGATPTGSVQFKIDGVNSGSPVALSGGVANYTSANQTPGAHTVTADYVPTGSFTASSGNTVSVNVVGVSTVNLTSSAGASVSPNTAVTLTAATGPVGTAGSVQFKKNGTNLGSPVTVASNQAQYVYTPTATETNAFTAVFTPSSPSVGASTSNTVNLVVSSSSATEDIVTRVEASGSLVISVNGCTYASGSLNPADGPAVGPKAGATGNNDGSNTINPCNDVILPTPTLDATAQVLRTSGSLLPVTITDGRVPDAPWSFTGQVDDFSNGTQSFTGAGLGWSPSITTHNLVGTTPIAGAAVTGAEGAGATFPTTGGLKTARAFAYTSAAGTGTSAVPTGSGLGTTVVGGGLTLNVPTNTVPGVYVAHLTLTAI